MKNIGEARRVFGIDILRDGRTCQMFLSHKIYLEKVIGKFSMAQAESVSTLLSDQFFKLN